MTKNFPIYGDHKADIRCFNCNGDLSYVVPQDKEYADGYGRYRKTCPQCGRHTYYDLQRKAVANV